MIRDLLSHTSGLMSGGASSTYPFAVGSGETLAQALPRLANDSARFPARHALGV
jgi:CubicO group peptidase (beta-lactamase class C family)